MHARNEKGLKNIAKISLGSCPAKDRLVFRGYPRGIAYPKGMQAFLYLSGVLLKDIKSFAEKTTATIKAFSLCEAQAAQRPITSSAPQWGGDRNNEVKK